MKGSKQHTRQTFNYQTYLQPQEMFTFSHPLHLSLLCLSDSCATVGVQPPSPTRILLSLVRVKRLSPVTVIQHPNCRNSTHPPTLLVPTYQRSTQMSICCSTSSFLPRSLILTIPQHPSTSDCCRIPPLHSWPNFYLPPKPSSHIRGYHQGIPQCSTQECSLHQTNLLYPSLHLQCFSITTKTHSCNLCRLHHRHRPHLHRPIRALPHSVNER